MQCVKNVQEKLKMLPSILKQRLVDTVVSLLSLHNNSVHLECSRIT